MILEIFTGVILLSLMSVQLLHLLYAYGFIRFFKSHNSSEKILDLRNNRIRELPRVRATVIIPEKNEELEILRRALEGVANLDWEREFLEVILVSDDPRDRWGEIDNLVHKLSALTKTKIVSLFRESPTGGRNGAINEAILRSSGDIIAIIDVDSIPSKDFLLKAYKRLSSNECDAVVGRWQGFSYYSTRIGEALATSTIFFNSILFYGRSSLGLYVIPLGSGTVYRRKVFYDVNFIDHDIVQDDYWIGVKMFSKGLKTCYEDSALIRVMVPSTYQAFKIQQSRWAYGAIQASIRGLSYIVRARDKLLKKIELLIYAFQYIPTLILSIIIPVFTLAYITIRPSQDPAIHLLPLLALWIISSTTYVIVYVAVIRRRIKISIFKALKRLGTSSAITSTLTPSVGLSQIRAFFKLREYRYKVTPKGRAEKIFSNVRELVLETLYTILLSAGFITSLILHHIGTLIVLGAFLSSYIYTLTIIVLESHGEKY